METRHDILEKAGHKTGYTVPEGYFDSVRSKIMQNLPEYQESKPEKLSMWKRVQPYVYMAAMFAGIWCMMKMFHMMTSTDLSLDNPPESIALAMADLDHNEWYAPADNTDVFIIEDDICSQYSSFDDFKKDFDNSDI
ncbi:MAG: hypothetical protein K2N48_08130 [Muribaculaceae bacterium]|nr:hypothetical protein [Muribaculaceae bacterium]